MRLWHVYIRDPDDCVENTEQSYVVRARHERQARRLVADPDNANDIWLDPERTACDQLPEDGDPEILLIDFKGN